MPSFVLALLLTFVTTFTSLSWAEEAVPAIPVQIAVQSFKVDNIPYLAISFQNFPHWHTYWKNPGDAGLAVKNQFLVNDKEIKLAEEEWPAPKRFIENGTQWAYGYVGSYTLFYRLEKSDLNKLSGKTLSLNSTWLVCKHICIPGQKKITFKITSGKVITTTADLMNPLDELELSSRFMNLPKFQPIPDYLDFKLIKGQKEKTLVLSYEVKKTTDVGFLNDANLMYSFPSPPFDFQHENLIVKEASLSGIVEINWDGEYSTPPVALPADGKFLKPYTIRFLFNDPVQRKVIVIEKKFGGFDLSGSTAVPATSPATNPPPTSTSGSQLGRPDTIIATAGSNSILYYLAVAFIGGLILNIMPCVLPVISLKLFGLVKYRNESRKRILEHNFFYTLGILSTFVVFGFIVLAAKSIGTQVGWGFQLQSPNFIAIMTIVLFVFALNMFGLFEFATPGGKSLGNIQTEDGFVGDFLSGVLATILSTPCSAPFLGTALTFAFTSSTSSIFLIFITIGLGLAFPFILTGFFPSLVSFLPRPGNWMNTIKKVLGLTLILTIIWLLDVYNALVDGSSHLIKLSTALVFIFAGIAILRKERWMAGISFLIAIGLFVNLSTTTVISSKDDQTALIRDKKAQGLNWEAWSFDKMKEHKENQQIVFIDFTAKWCFTCKINEKLVLDTEKFKQFVADNNLKLLIGDWTKRDELIGIFLRQNGLVGVPAYFIQKKDGTLVNLGETVTIDRIKQNLK
ncbi:MAG: thioredoxin family protein [Bacteriovorax sp.]|nr:thioredoxin family protein [Bacteriovorax sp.]